MSSAVRPEERRRSRMGAVSSVRIWTTAPSSSEKRASSGDVAGGAISGPTGAGKGRSRGEVDLEANAAGEGHFGEGDEEAAVGAVVIREQFARAIEMLDRVEEREEFGGFGRVGGFAAGEVVNLREGGVAEAVAAFTEVDEKERDFGLKLGCERAADVGDRSEAGDDDGERRDNGARL